MRVIGNSIMILLCIFKYFYINIAVACRLKGKISKTMYKGMDRFEEKCYISMNFTIILRYKNLNNSQMEMTSPINTVFFRKFRQFHNRIQASFPFCYSKRENKLNKNISKSYVYFTSILNE